MSEHALPPPNYITSALALDELVEHLQDAPLIALDTESNSLYAYRERVCLIQLSTREQDYIIDPLKIRSLTPLTPIFADPKVEKVFHAAEYDLMCLKRDYGFTFRGIFDTMIAARICGYKNVGLGNLLNEIFQVKPDKRHQLDNWGKRPLSAESLLYAQMDTHYLPALRDHFIGELKKRKALDEAREAFAEAADVLPARRVLFDPDGYWRIAIPNHLTAREIAVLRELYLLRERLAKKRDLPPFKVFTDKLIIHLARVTPRHLDDLKAVHGISNAQAKRYGSLILEAVERGTHARPPTPPEPDPPADPDVVNLYTALREWRKRRAAKRGVESDVIISREALWTLAERAPRSLDEMRGVRGLGEWRIKTYGKELLDVIRRSR